MIRFKAPLGHEWKKWKHVFKLDPERSIEERDLERICRSGTDAIIVGGSTGVNDENAGQLLRRIERYPVPVVQEISHVEAVIPGYDHYFVPLVMNVTDARWIVGEHQRAVKKFDGLIPWDHVTVSGYIILNEQAAAAVRTGAITALDADDVLAYARIADRMLRLPILYMEYSGRYGDIDLVREIAGELQSCRLFYGGGIDGAKKAEAAARAADTVVVGNVIYDQIDKALETVTAVKHATKG